jgi:hypothetical protein
MQKTNYLIPEEHPEFPNLMVRYGNIFKSIESEPDKKIVIKIPPSVVDSLDNSMWGEMLGVAEHNTKWIELLLFGVGFSFIKIADSGLLYVEGEWQSDKNIQSWLRRLGEGIPFSSFFLSQYEARLLSVIGDLIKQPHEVRIQGDETKVKFSFNSEEQKIIDSRIGIGCQLFMHYCNGTGFDPKQAVEAILAEFNVWYDYTLVLGQFEKDIKDGAQFRIGFGGKKPMF